MNKIRNNIIIIPGGVKKKFRRLEGCGIKSMRHSKANVDDKVLIGTIKHL